MGLLSGLMGFMDSVVRRKRNADGVTVFETDTGKAARMDTTMHLLMKLSVPVSSSSWSTILAI